MQSYVPSLKKRCIDWILKVYTWAFAPKLETFNVYPKSIFVLRNNDRGDLLTTTPLFEGLKKAFPEAKILLGTGSWNLPLLEHNPYVDQVLTLDAPWHNKALAKPGRGPAWQLLKGLWYSLSSRQLGLLRALGPEIGIDVLGSVEGAFLLLQARIPYRLGVRGYAGGHTACQAYLDFDPQVHVSAFALRFLKLLGKEEGGHIAPRPQIYLSALESQEAEGYWLGYEKSEKKSIRILLAPGGGFSEKCWPLDYFCSLLRLMASAIQATIILVGSSQEKSLGQVLKMACPWVHDRMGCDSLRFSLALAERSDCIICNSSLMMHVGAAFKKQTLVLLGDAFEDARAHERLWSYPETHTVLGKEHALAALTRPEEAWKGLQMLLEKIKK